VALEIVYEFRIPWWRTRTAIAAVHVARVLAWVGAKDASVGLATWGCEVVMRGVRGSAHRVARE